jgi:metal-dependent amidase/aminoacylase/carboxypeptidase family protein
MHGLNSQALQDIFLAIALIGGTLIYWRSRVPTQTIKNLQASNASYIQLDAARREEVSELRKKLDTTITNHSDERLELNKALAELQGQVKVYKELPLQQMATAMQDISEVNRSIAASNNKILETLQASAVIAHANADDGGLLVRTKEQ